MDALEVREFALSLAGVTEDMPFGDDVVALRVGGKIFALISFGTDRLAINLKCDPDRSVELREFYRQITPGYHMNKRHWNTLSDLPSLPSWLVRDLVEHSYTLVFSSLPQRLQRSIGGES